MKKTIYKTILTIFFIPFAIYVLPIFLTAAVFGKHKENEELFDIIAKIFELK